MKPQLDPTTLDMPTEGSHLQLGTLRDQLSERATLLVFLRHFG